MMTGYDSTDFPSTPDSADSADVVSRQVPRKSKGTTSQSTDDMRRHRSSSSSKKSPSKRGSRNSMSNLAHASSRSQSKSMSSGRKLGVSPARQPTAAGLTNNLTEMNRLRDQLEEQRLLAAALKEENKTLKLMAKRQEKAIKELDKEQGDLPTILEKMSEEIRVTKTQAKKYLEKINAYEKSLRDLHEELTQARTKCDRLERISKEKNADADARMNGKLADATRKLEQQEEAVQMWERKHALLEKTRHNELKAAQEKNAELRRELALAQDELARTQNKAQALPSPLARYRPTLTFCQQQYESAMARENIYAKHLSTYHGTAEVSGASTPASLSVSPVPPVVDRSRKSTMERDVHIRSRHTTTGSTAAPPEHQSVPVPVSEPPSESSSPAPVHLAPDIAAESPQQSVSIAAAPSHYKPSFKPATQLLPTINDVVPQVSDSELYNQADQNQEVHKPPTPVAPQPSMFKPMLRKATLEGTLTTALHTETSNGAYCHCKG
ncbi:hypothetical protein RI367_000060 [Sorochytrium milnesiophthora]